MLTLVNKDAMFDARHLLDPRTEVLLSWMDGTSKDILNALTFVADDYFQSLLGADIALISKNKGIKFFGKMAVPFSELINARVFDVKLKVTANNSTYLRMVEATRLVWDPWTGRRDLWSLLLNHHPKDLKITNIFAEANVPENESRAALENISCLTKTPLNESQMRVIHGTKSLTGGLQLVQAPGGTGKTTTLSILTRVYQQTKLCILLCAPTNTAVNELCKRYTHLFGENSAPLRIHAADVDQENTILGINRQKGATFDEHMIFEDVITLELIQAMVGTQKRRKKLITGSDLLSQCLERAKSRNYTVLEKYVDGEDDEGQPRYVGPSVNMYDELYDYHVKAQDYTQDPFFEWRDDDKRKFTQALQYVKEHVIRSASIIGTTTNGIGRKIISQNVGISEAFRGVVIIIDEASRESEANIYVAMTKVAACSKIVGIHMVGDVMQGLPMVTSNRAIKPKTSNSNFAQEAYN